MTILWITLAMMTMMYFVGLGIGICIGKGMK
jgi:hypothetical protein